MTMAIEQHKLCPASSKQVCYGWDVYLLHKQAAV